MLSGIASIADMSEPRRGFAFLPEPEMDEWPRWTYLSFNIRVAFVDSMAVRVSGVTAMASIERSVSKMNI